MSPSREDGGERRDGASPTRRPSPPASPRVQLEVAFLDADQAAPAPDPAAAFDERTCLTVLVVAAEADLRRYVRECLRDHTDLRLVEAATVVDAVTLAAQYSPELVILDEPESDVLLTLSEPRAIVIVDELPHAVSASGPRRRLLAHPFTAEGLVAEVDRLLG
jgi:hypothetical protein